MKIRRTVFLVYFSWYTYFTNILWGESVIIATHKLGGRTTPYEARRRVCEEAGGKASDGAPARGAEAPVEGPTNGRCCGEAGGTTEGTNERGGA